MVDEWKPCDLTSVFYTDTGFNDLKKQKQFVISKQKILR